MLGPQMCIVWRMPSETISLGSSGLCDVSNGV